MRNASNITPSTRVTPYSVHLYYQYAAVNVGDLNARSDRHDDASSTILCSHTPRARYDNIINHLCRPALLLHLSNLQRYVM